MINHINWIYGQIWTLRKSNGRWFECSFIIVWCFFLVFVCFFVRSSLSATEFELRNTNNICRWKKNTCVNTQKYQSNANCAKIEKVRSKSFLLLHADFNWKSKPRYFLLSVWPFHRIEPFGWMEDCWPSSDAAMRSAHARYLIRSFIGKFCSFISSLLCIELFLYLVCGDCDFLFFFLTSLLWCMQNMMLCLAAIWTNAHVWIGVNSQTN